MLFSNTQLAKNMLSRLLRIRKNNKNMSFSNMQFNKKYDITIIFMMT